MQVQVHSEIGPLRHVLVHQPGDEVGRMTQEQLEELLFDDILAQSVAATEHAVLQDILRAGGARVDEIETLLADALQTAPDDAVAALLRDVCDVAGIPDVVGDLLAEWEPARLSRGLIAGVFWDELPKAPPTLARLRQALDQSTRMPLNPQPNLMFMRDACFSVGDRVAVGRMARGARAREPFLVHFALKHSGVLGKHPRFLFDAPDAHRHPVFRSIEGGDVLVPSERFVLIGCSERTTPQTIERLAHEALFPHSAKLESVYAVMMPRKRSVMHLDTLFTQIDHDLFLGHEPLVVAGGLPVVRITRDQPPEVASGAGGLMDVLRDELGPQVHLAPCGGRDPVHQQREQWTDGANAVCLSPGKIILYSRNVQTIKTLEGFGFEEVHLSPAVAPEERMARIADGMTRDRTVFSFTGSELARARGGARCLTMPIHRAALD